MKRKSKKRRKLLLMSASLCLSLLIAEGLIRLMSGQHIVLYPRFHAEATYGPYVIRCLKRSATFWHHSVDGSWKFATNSKGFRSDVEYSYEKSDDVLRIICLGDSHTQGFECRQDKTYASVMQKFFEARGVHAEVINAGVSGFSTAEALVFLEHDGVRYLPDAVVLGFFANDLDDNIKADLFRLQAGKLVEHSFRHTPATRILRFINATPLRWLSQNSYLYSRLFNTVWKWAKKGLYTRKTKELVSEYAVAKEGDAPDIAEHKRRLCTILLERMYNFCQTNDICFVIADIPCGKDGFKTWKSSIPAELQNTFVENCDVLVHSTNVLSKCCGVMDVFVPHGQRHISETTHMLLGVAAARGIADKTGILTRETMLDSP